MYNLILTSTLFLILIPKLREPNKVEVSLLLSKGMLVDSDGPPLKN